jgi:CelD/BcsL family acetyltransferase involved in cellulose biosynthesis
LDAADPRWRTFAEQRSTSPLQLPAWLDLLTVAYRRRGRVVALADATGAIVAALPMVHSKLPWQSSWTALPFTDTLAPIAVNEQARDELLTALAAEPSDGPVLVRTEARLQGWTPRELGTVQLIDVSNGADGVLRGASSATRRNVKRARRAEAGLSAKPLISDREFLGPNLALITQTRRRLGAPTQPRRYWARLWELHERQEALTVGVYLRDRLVASGVFVVGNDHAVYKYGASDSATWELRPNFLMFATAFDLIAARGVRTLDFGITDLSNRSLREFKTRWGGDELPAYYSATDPRLLPKSLEPARLLTRTIQHTPTLVGRGVGALAYPFVS